MSLSVYKLDGAPGEGAICVLSRGEHPIGRGPLLQCFDKRASRHQALIKVEVESSSITSTHKNPCFYQSSKSKTIIILPENSPVDIHTGDKFGLFPDKCWFKFHFEPEEGSTAMSETKASQNEGHLKRSPELSLEVVERKQLKLAEGYHDDESNQSSEISVPKKKIVQHKLVESNTEGNSQVIDRERSSDDASKRVGQDGTSKLKSGVENVQIKLESAKYDESNALRGSADGKIKVNAKGSHGNDHVCISDNENIKTVGYHDDECNHLSNIENVQIAQETLESNILNGAADGERNGKIVNADGCHGNGHHECITDNSEHEDVASSNANAHDSEPIGKKEKLSNSENDEGEKNDQREEEKNDEHKKEENDQHEEEVNDQHEEEENDQHEEEENDHEEEKNDQHDAPEADGNASVSTKREKCWYGSGCYRKNSKHRFQFSHPGDADHISDPNEDRPTCSYGANCYRRNKDHRKQYKHPGKPADQKRKRKQATPATKATAQNDESSEDDYDYDDPFLDDSEDEYKEESWSECDSDEWENSQSASDEDTMKNLLKEAKRFTRTKK